MARQIWFSYILTIHETKITHGKGWVSTSSRGVDQKLYEVFVVIDSNTISNPRTVVIHL